MKEVVAYCRAACAKQSDPSAEAQLQEQMIRCYADARGLITPCGWGKEGIFVLSAPLVPKSHTKAIIAPGANLGGVAGAGRAAPADARCTVETYRADHFQRKAL